MLDGDADHVARCRPLRLLQVRQGFRGRRDDQRVADPVPVERRHAEVAAQERLRVGPRRTALDPDRAARPPYRCCGGRAQEILRQQNLAGAGTGKLVDDRFEGSGRERAQLPRGCIEQRERCPGAVHRDGGQPEGGPGFEVILVEQGSRGDEAHDLAPDELLPGTGLFDLIADRHLVSRGYEAGDVLPRLARLVKVMPRMCEAIFASS